MMAYARKMIKGDLLNMAFKLAEHDYYGFVFWYSSANLRLNLIGIENADVWDKLVQEAIEYVNNVEGANLTMNDYKQAFDEYVQKHY